jgi:hypothetical protein
MIINIVGGPEEFPPPAKSDIIIPKIVHMKITMYRMGQAVKRANVMALPLLMS